MKYLKFEFLVIFLVLTAGKCAKRVKRDLLDLADMFETSAELDPTEYAPYGNWCGYGGGGVVLDAIDSCCETHDNCYESAMNNECPQDELVHIVQYFWSMINDTIVCDENQTECELKVCQCDKAVVECIDKNKHVYSEKHRYARYEKSPSESVDKNSTAENNPDPST